MIVNVLRYWFGTLSSGSRAAVLDEVYFSSPAFSWSVHIFFGHILPMKWLTDASSLSLISGRQTLFQVVGGRWLAFWVTLKQKTSSLCTAHPSNPNKNRGERRLFTGYKRNNIQKTIVIQWYSYVNSDSPGNDYCLRVSNRPPQPDFMIDCSASIFTPQIIWQEEVIESNPGCATLFYQYCACFSFAGS